MTAVLVTGASRGIGAGLVAAFAAAGWDVAVTARSKGSARRVAEGLPKAGGRVIAVGCDVTRSGAVAAAVAAAEKAFGGLDAFIHNAVSDRSSDRLDLASASLRVWEEHASVSLSGAWRCARAAYPALRARQGALLILTSPAGINGTAGNPFYAAVKAGERGFVRSLAREWGAEGIRVNALAPLAMTPALQDAFEKDAAMQERLINMVPLRRFGDSRRDIGPAAIFLCSQEARYVTGQTLVVSGGRLTTA